MNEPWQWFHAAAAELGQRLAFDPALLGTPEALLRLALFLALLVGSAFFSSAETALFSLSRLDLRELRRSGNPAADTIHALLDQPRRLIISILCGNELINVAAAANMASLLLLLYAPEAVLLVNLLVTVPLLLLLGEVTPKTIAVTDPVRISTRITARPLAVWVRLVAPLRWLLRQVSDRVPTLFVGEERGPENILRVDELRSLVEEVVEQGELHAVERALIDNILAAGATAVVDIMLPRTRVDFIDADLPMPAIVTELRRLRRRQLPVFRGHRDNVVGMLHAEDIARPLLDGHLPESLDLGDVLRPEMVPVAEAYGNNHPLLLDRLAAMPHTLVHFDFRSDNLFFDDDGSVVVIDWQSISVGGGAADVGYFLGQNLPTEVRREHEDRLLRAYHDTLVAEGVSDYPFEQFFDDYRLGVVYGWVIPVFAVGSLDVSSERAMALWSAVIERVQDAIFDHGADEFIAR